MSEVMDYWAQRARILKQLQEKNPTFANELKALSPLRFYLVRNRINEELSK